MKYAIVRLTLNGAILTLTNDNDWANIVIGSDDFDVYCIEGKSQHEVIKMLEKEGYHNLRKTNPTFSVVDGEFEYNVELGTYIVRDKNNKIKQFLPPEDHYPIKAGKVREGECIAI